MLEILEAMMKEEWRVHSSFFGGRMFILFPLLIAAFTFGFSLFLPMFIDLMGFGEIVALLHYTALLFGVSIGGFALAGRELMNRRFGQASMMAYSGRTLPVSERALISNMIANDVIFYFLLYIIPFFAGFSSAGLISGALVAVPVTLLATMSLSFLMGLSLMYFLTTLYVHTGRIFILFLLFAGAGLFAGGSFILRADIVHMLPTISLFSGFTWPAFLMTLLLIIVPGAVSLAAPKIEFPESTKRMANRVDGLSSSLGRLFSDPHFIAKDMLDLHRSEGGLGKIAFSFILPLVLIWAMLHIFTGLFHFPQETMFLIFAALVGALSSSIYNWLTEFDTFSSYAFLPVSVRDVIGSKLKAYAILNSVSFAILITAAWINGQTGGLVWGVPLFAVISAYSCTATVYISGLNPGILLFNGKVFGQYIVFIAPVMVLSILASIINPLLLTALLPASAGISYLFMKKGMARWDSRDQAFF
jgi:hypothetical protein